LRYVGGNLAYAAMAYARSRPLLLPEFPDWHAKRVTEYGVAFVCLAEQADCIAQSSSIASRNPQSRKIEIQLARSYLGIPGQQQSYVIFIVPPG